MNGNTIETLGLKCCGCSTCVSTCPVKCISMLPNSEGFLYPHIDHKRCIECGLCLGKCFVYVHDLQKKLSEPLAYSAIIRDPNILNKSSSGGVFTALSAMVLQKGGCVFGAAFANQFHKVQHIMVDNVNDLSRLRGSKYLQSEIGKSYAIVKEQVRKGREVLFSGTPCQIVGLKKYLGRDYENLILIDIICHGVPSPLVWQKYLQHIKKSVNGHIKSVNFRQKKNGWQQFGIEICSEDAICYYNSVHDDPYMQLFLRNICLRESCYQCPVKSDKYYSDITIGDFWGIEKVAPEVDRSKGVSLILVHTNKGKRILNDIKDCLEIKDVNYNIAISFNSAYVRSVFRPTERGLFFDDLKSLEWRDLEKKYLRLKPLSIVQKVKKDISSTIIGRILRKLKNSWKNFI